MKYVKIENNIVTNTIICDNADHAKTLDYILATDPVEINWLFNGTTFTPPAINNNQTLEQAKVLTISKLESMYSLAISNDVTITTEAGNTVTFQADDASRTTLQNTLNGLTSTKVTPPGFYWKAADNTNVAVTYTDLLNFAAAIFANGWSAFQNLQAKKLLVEAATTSEAALAITF